MDFAGLELISYADNLISREEADRGGMLFSWTGVAAGGDGEW